MIPELAVFGPIRLRRLADEFVNFEQYLEQDDEAEEDAHVINSKAERINA